MRDRTANAPGGDGPAGRVVPRDTGLQLNPQSSS
eukprot:CAMPEP_0177333210 /NCGR_PEP_ID=MMETSP0368-20130122/22034_1 /TAXON_ID=447022 ORGANISM="Scrippsiella hangoei-like, Strain SHHI-4" /NCGR_SAMPLE_ID=MMETSP0368 /ASSEMBLY_ACC=CAM_ASM_000363 /LENGTH=33 /DNA_ID= /DNA_START= /DNA_END= /DNA_ORIENTATION=